MDISSEAIAVRRDLHKIPELGLEEYHTLEYICTYLSSACPPGAIEIHRGYGGTGILALLKGKQVSSRCIGIRADMDGLPVTETSDIPYKSRHDGFMHACGHDGHMAMALVAAKYLSFHTDSFSGVVKFIFQPGEEGKAGAKKMLEDGLLDHKPVMEKVFGLHLWNEVEAGVVGAKLGPLMAASGRFDISIIGQGGHGAAPHETVDAAVAAAHLVTQLHTIVARNVDPLDTAVLSVGRIEAGYTFNVIADKAQVQGTIRAFKQNTFCLLKKRIEDICKGVALAFNVEVDVIYPMEYPVTETTSLECLRDVLEAAKSVVGDVSIKEPVSTMCAEDFSFFLNKVPGCFFFLGSKIADGIQRPHHKANFDFDESVLGKGALIWIKLVQNLLHPE